MTPYVPRLLGDPRFPRYVVVWRRSGKRRYWTGRGWSGRHHEALLFADLDDLNREIARLYANLLRRTKRDELNS